MTAFLKDAILFLSGSPELLLLTKATILLLLALTAASFAARHRASTRHLIWTASFAALLVLPLIVTFAPGATVEVPVPVVAENAVILAPAGPSRTVQAGLPLNPSVGAPPGSTTRHLPTTAEVLRASWIAGILLFLAPLLLDLFRLQRLRRNALPWTAAQHRIPRNVELLLHEDIPTPLACGILNPAVILPAAARDWPEAELRCALTHELEHIRRRDWPIHLATRAIAALYWFHPLAWTAWRRLSLEAERACDDAVIQSEESTTYADQLVSLAESMNNTHTQLALGMAQRGDLSTRVSALLDQTQQRGRATRFATITAASAAVLAVFALAPLTAVAQPQSPVPLPAPKPQPNAQPKPSPVPHTVRTRPSALDRALYEACEEGSLTDIGALLNAGANVNALVHGDGTPLLGAARKGHLEVVRFLLDRGADPNLGIAGDGNPLLTAADGGHLEVVKMLLDRGANPDAAVPGDGNALITAAQNGHLAILGLLLDRGATIDLIVPGDENALMQASEHGHLTAVRYLVSRGANVNTKTWVEHGGENGKGEWRTPLNRAQKNGHTAVADYLKSQGARE